MHVGLNPIRDGLVSEFGVVCKGSPEVVETNFS